MCVFAPSTTAKKTANVTDTGGQRRIILESGRAGSIRSGPVWTPTDDRPAVFKTVCGALLRRPGWVRFPSIPAKSRLDDSQDDSHSSGRPRMATDAGARARLLLYEVGRS